MGFEGVVVPGTFFSAGSSHRYFRCVCMLKWTTGKRANKESGE